MSQLCAGHVGFRFDAFDRDPVLQAMSGRVGCAPSEGDVGYSPACVREHVDANRRAFADEAGFDLPALALGRQTHGIHVQRVTAGDRGRGQPPLFDGFPATDALITDCPAVAIGVVVADCVPLLLYDRRNQALGVAHAGWRGTVGLIARETLRAMIAAFGTRPQDVIAGIGPSIGPCCYEVGDEVIAAWRAAGLANAEHAVERRGPRYHFDLWTANRLILSAEGVPRRQIEDSALCTRCFRDRFFSYRAAQEGLALAGRMMLVAQLGVE